MACRLCFGRGLRLLLAALAACSSTLAAQELMTATDGAVRPLYTDNAVLESTDARKDLPCTVDPIKPSLGFDLRFHAGYRVTVPLKELAGDGGLLTMIFKVTPEGGQSPVYLLQHVPVPEIQEDAKGDAHLLGEFDLGEGKYHIAWMMRDRTEHVCSSNWDAEATLSGRDKDIPMEIAGGAVKPSDEELFKPEPQSAANRGDGRLNVRVLVNFAPQDSSSAALVPVDINALVTILRTIARDPHIGTFSVVAFNMEEHRVLFRQEGVSQIDFPALGQALHYLNLGTVDLKQLGQKHSGAEFLAGLLNKEIGGNPDPPDAVIIAGPKTEIHDSVPDDALKGISESNVPVFYMNYVLDPVANPWRDAIGGAVRTLKGTEFTISRPRDLFAAWTDIVGRIVKSKFGRAAANGASLR